LGLLGVVVRWEGGSGMVLMMETCSAEQKAEIDHDEARATYLHGTWKELALT